MAANESLRSFTKKRLKKPLRFQKLVMGLREGKTITAIAEECGVSRVTMENDFLDWKDNGGFDKWLLSEFMILHDDETQKEKSDAYRIIADLLKKRLKEQVELQGAVQIDLAWEPEKQSSSHTRPTLGNSNSTTAQNGSACSCAAGDSAKPLPAQTKQSSKASGVV